MGDAKRRREAADPVTAAVAAVEESCRDAAMKTARGGGSPASLVTALYKHLVAILASVQPPDQGTAAAAGLARSLAEDVRTSRDRAAKAVGAPPGPEDTVQ